MKRGCKYNEAGLETRPVDLPQHESHPKLPNRVCNPKDGNKPLLLQQSHLDHELWGDGTGSYYEGRYKLPEAACFHGALGIRGYSAEVYSTTSTAILIVYNMPFSTLENELWDYDNAAEEPRTAKPWDGKSPDFHRTKWDASHQRRVAVERLPTYFREKDVPHFLLREGPIPWKELKRKLCVCLPSNGILNNAPLRHLDTANRTTLLTVFQAGVVIDFGVVGAKNVNSWNLSCQSALLENVGKLIKQCEYGALPTSVDTVATRGASIKFCQNIMSTDNSGELIDSLLEHTGGKLIDLVNATTLESSTFSAAVALLFAGGHSAGDATPVQNMIDMKFKDNSYSLLDALNYAGTLLQTGSSLVVVRSSPSAGSTIEQIVLFTSLNITHLSVDLARRFLFMPAVTTVIVNSDPTNVQLSTVVIPNVPRVCLKLNPRLRDIESARAVQPVVSKEYIAQVVNEMLLQTPADKRAAFPMTNERGEAKRVCNNLRKASQLAFQTLFDAA